MSTLNPEMPCHALDASIIAYDIKGGKIPKSAKYYKDVVKKGTTPAVFVDGPDEINAGYVAESPEDWVYVAFRGTLPLFEGDFWRWVLDWLNDFRLGPMAWMVKGKLFGQVETGFGTAVEELWRGIDKALATIDWSKKKGIIVAGHSKGGGMAFPAAARIKAHYESVPIHVCTFAAPLTCDRTFQRNYDNKGLAPFTLRYQNQYDIVPFLPYYPYFSFFAAAERLATQGPNQFITTENWPSRLENDYVRIGLLRYLGDRCRIETGEQGQEGADQALRHALEHLDLTEIVDAHSASGRYHTCICSS